MSQDPDEEEHQRLGFRKVEWDDLDALVTRLESMLGHEVKEGEPYPMRADIERFMGQRIQHGGSLPATDAEMDELMGEVDAYLKKLKEGQ